MQAALRTCGVSAGGPLQGLALHYRLPVARLGAAFGRRPGGARRGGSDEAAGGASGSPNPRISTVLRAPLRPLPRRRWRPLHPPRRCTGLGRGHRRRRPRPDAAAQSAKSAGAQSIFGAGRAGALLHCQCPVRAPAPGVIRDAATAAATAAPQGPACQTRAGPRALPSTRLLRAGLAGGADLPLGGWGRVHRPFGGFEQRLAEARRGLSLCGQGHIWPKSSVSKICLLPSNHPLARLTSSIARCRPPPFRANMLSERRQTAPRIRRAAATGRRPTAYPPPPPSEDPPHCAAHRWAHGNLSGAHCGGGLRLRLMRPGRLAHGQSPLRRHTGGGAGQHRPGERDNRRQIPEAAAV